MNNNSETGMRAGWPEARKYNKSIRLEMSIYLAGMMLALMAVLGYVITERYVNDVTRHVARELLVQARSSSSTAVNHLISNATPDNLMLSNICNKVVAENADVYWAGIAGNDGVFLAHSNIREVVTGGTLRPLSAVSQSPGHLHDGEALLIQTDTIFVSIPIQEENIVLGRLEIAASLDSIIAARRASIATVVTITLSMIGLGIPLTVWLLSRKLRPIKIIAESLKDVRLGDEAFEIKYASRNEIGYLAESLRAMGKSVVEAHRELLEKRRVFHELQIASDIQKQMLPGEYPRGAMFESFGAYQSAREVGGDYYDFIDLDDRHMAIIVADVSGKSLPAMMFMLMTRDIIRKLLITPPYEPAEVLAQANAELESNISEGVFVSMFFGVLDKESGEVSFASAGHTSLITISGMTGGSSVIKTKGYPLGLVDSNEFRLRIESSSILLGPQDWLLLYTDGLTDAKNTEGETLDRDRLIGILETRRTLRPAELVVQTIQEIKSYAGEAPQFDDMTLVALKWCGPAPDTELAQTNGGVIAACDS